jgi:hypothetical protein
VGGAPWHGALHLGGAAHGEDEGGVDAHQLLPGRGGPVDSPGPGPCPYRSGRHGVVDRPLLRSPGHRPGPAGGRCPSRPTGGLRPSSADGPRRSRPLPSSGPGWPPSSADSLPRTAGWPPRKRRTRSSRRSRSGWRPSSSTQASKPRCGRRSWSWSAPPAGHEADQPSARGTAGAGRHRRRSVRRAVRVRRSGAACRALGDRAGGPIRVPGEMGVRLHCHLDVRQEIESHR